MGEPINPHDHEAWNKVDDYLSGKLGDETFNDMTIDWHSAQYQDTEQELQVNAIVPLRVPYSVFRKPEAELAKLREENQTLRAGAVEQVRRLEQLRDERDAARGCLIHEQEMCAEQAKTIEQLKAVQHNTEELAAALREEVKHLCKRIDELIADNQRLRNDIELQIAENDGLRRAPEVLKTELGSLIQEISKQRDGLQATLDQVYQERDKANRKVIELERANTELQQRIISRDSALDDKDEQIEQLQTKLNDIQLILHNDGQGE